MFQSPVLTHWEEPRQGEVQFRLEGCNVSLANAIRRTILSDIPVVCIRGFRIEDCDREGVNMIQISKNTSRLHNEIIKQRISLLPVFSKCVRPNTATSHDPYLPGHYYVQLDVQNSSNDVVYVTTDDFRLFKHTQPVSSTTTKGSGNETAGVSSNHLKTATILQQHSELQMVLQDWDRAWNAVVPSAEDLAAPSFSSSPEEEAATTDRREDRKTQAELEVLCQKLFPKDPLTHAPIDLLRLMPKIGDMPGQEIRLTAEFSVANAAMDAMFNVVSKCSYGNTIDEKSAKEAWKQREDAMRDKATKDGFDALPQEVEFEKRNFMCLDRERFFFRDSFDFVVHSLGIYTVEELFQKACRILQIKFLRLLRDVRADAVSLQCNADGYLREPWGISKMSNHKTLMENTVDVEIPYDDYTLGKCLEYYVYREYFLKRPDERGNKNGWISVAFVAFRKIHPHDSSGVLRIAFENVADAPPTTHPLSTDSTTTTTTTTHPIQGNGLGSIVPSSGHTDGGGASSSGAHCLSRANCLEYARTIVTEACEALSKVYQHLESMPRSATSTAAAAAAAEDAMEVDQETK